MGLDTTHGAWHGSYSAFDRFRNALVVAAGGEYTDTRWTTDDDIVPEEHFMGMSILLSHSDCSGFISVEKCPLVAAALEWIAPRVTEDGDGHLSRGCRAATLEFAAGCRAAHEAGEALEFH